MTIGPFTLPLYDDDKEPEAATSELDILASIFGGLEEAETRLASLEGFSVPMDPVLFPQVGAVRVLDLAEAVRAEADGAVAQAEDSTDLLLTYGPLVPAGDPEVKWTARSAGVTIDTDGTMAADSDAVVPSQKAVRTYTAAQVAALVASAPSLLNTLDELAAALGDDANFAATMTTALAAKADASGTTTALAGKVDKSTYDANSILIATADNTPIALAMGASTILLRLSTGDIIAGTPAQLRTLLPTLSPLTGFTDASQNTRQTFMVGPSTFNAVGARMLTAGIIRGVTVQGASSRTAGSMLLEVYKNGSATGITVTWNTGSGAAGSLGSVTYAAGDVLDVRQTNSSFTPSTHFVAQIWTEQTA